MKSYFRKNIKQKLNFKVRLQIQQYKYHIFPLFIVSLVNILITPN